MDNLNLENVRNLVLGALITSICERTGILPPSLVPITCIVVLILTAAFPGNKTVVLDGGRCATTSFDTSARLEHDSSFEILFTKDCDRAPHNDRDPRPDSTSIFKPSLNRIASRKDGLPQEHNQMKLDALYSDSAAIPPSSSSSPSDSPVEIPLPIRATTFILSSATAADLLDEASNPPADVKNAAFPAPGPIEKDNDGWTTVPSRNRLKASKDHTTKISDGGHNLELLSKISSQGNHFDCLSTEPKRRRKGRKKVMAQQYT